VGKENTAADVAADEVDADKALSKEPTTSITDWSCDEQGKLSAVMLHGFPETSHTLAAHTAVEVATKSLRALL